MSDWLLDPDVAYLNHGAFGALSRPVAAAAAELRAMVERDPAHLLMRQLPGMLADVRDRLAAFLTADPAGCVFVPNATTGSATVLASLAAGLDAGDEVVYTDHRYQAVQVQLDVLAGRAGVVPVRAHVPLDARTDADVVDAVTACLTERTRLLVVDAIASASGFVFPVAALVEAAHARGVPVLVDAAHAPGQVEVDLTATGADFWVGNLHKWVCSPRAAAVLAVAPKWRDAVHPLVASHGYAAGFHDAFDWTGTSDVVPVLAIPAALDFWDGLGWDEVRRKRADLVDAGAAAVAAALGTEAPTADRFRAAMRVVRLPRRLTDEQAREVESRLATEHLVEVSLMDLHEASWVRVCGQVYNRPDDYLRLAKALPELL